MQKLTIESANPQWAAGIKWPTGPRTLGPGPRAQNTGKETKNNERDSKTNNEWDSKENNEWDSKKNNERERKRMTNGNANPQWAANTKWPTVPRGLGPGRRAQNTGKSTKNDEWDNKENNEWDIKKNNEWESKK